eukprot:TRINITY_DN22339_c1_g1_i1.p1 TRINITY_DN22339_c1_g1~~TRINITY_DN22339_c1_g1_i1.p1  ORF type:complete len:292 (+),score=116.75 TRINITY_DN22339_c1_g1_i1:70-876(+)
MAAAGAAAAAGSSQLLNTPRETLYLSGLPDKVKRHELKRQLYYLCSAYGRIVDIVCQGAPRKRGQAFVIFNDVQSATTCMRRLQGFPFNERPMQIEYARTKSDCIALRDGTFRKKDARQRQRDNIEKDRAWEKRQREQRSAGKVAGAARPAITAAGKRQRDPAAAAAAAEPAAQRPRREAGEPNCTLFITGIPAGLVAAGAAALRSLLSQFQGFHEARLPPASVSAIHGVCAFAEFDSVQQAAAALSTLHGFQVDGGHTLEVSYAKKG